MKCDHKMYHVIGEQCPCVNPYAIVVDLLAWLTTREKSITMSASHNSGDAVDVMKEYTKLRGFKECNDIAGKCTIREELDKIHNYKRTMDQ